MAGARDGPRHECESEGGRQALPYQIAWTSHSSIIHRSVHCQIQFFKKKGSMPQIEKVIQCNWWKQVPGVMRIE